MCAASLSFHSRASKVIKGVSSDSHTQSPHEMVAVVMPTKNSKKSPQSSARPSCMLLVSLIATQKNSSTSLPTESCPRTSLESLPERSRVDTNIFVLLLHRFLTFVPLATQSAQRPASTRMPDESRTRQGASNASRNAVVPPVAECT